MNPIDNLFTKKENNILSVYFTAGYPQVNDTGLILRSLERAGADLVEIGFPFSDPVADGPVIQESSHQALENGMNLDILFDQLECVMDVAIPKILMGYFNTVYQYDIEKFIERCTKTGISGVIIPDLKPEVYMAEYHDLFIQAGLYFICLVTPQTSRERTLYIENVSKGFVYLVSTSATTGQLPTKFLQLNQFGKFSLPTLIGFGIHNRETFYQACQFAHGAIIGSEFIRQFSGLKDMDQDEERLQKISDICQTFINRIKG